MAQEKDKRIGGQGRVFLFLQGPHGPFFQGLGRALEATGARAFRIGFNTGDSAFWPDRRSYIPFRGMQSEWPAFLQKIVSQKQVTDVVLYSNTRWMHRTAKTLANSAGLALHIFEEGYLRPYWISYERDGSNGQSPLMQIDINQMKAVRDRMQLDTAVPPSHWGDTRQHIFYGALYHWFVMFLNQRYPSFRAHRALKVHQEFWLNLKRLLLLPLHSAERWLATFRIRRGGYPYHLALLQLEHDASFQTYGPFDSQAQFVQSVIEGFAAGAAAHHHLVFKAHPLEDGRVPLKAVIKDAARAHGVLGRIHFVRGGKLAWLLKDARSAVTVNSTAGQQALWRGIPLRALGQAVYCKPELVSDQPLADFFMNPQKPDHDSYRVFRDFLLKTSQLPGSFYAKPGRQQALRQVVDLLLAASDPYARHQPESAAPAQQLRSVK
ncbi:MAG: capsule biosynthesis protein CapA [Pseudomonadota bacterium]